MAKRYDNELKVTIVELLQSGMKAKQISEDYGVAPSLISRWKKDYEAKSGDFSKKREPTKEEQELKALRKELRDVKMERDILKKAVSIFSKSDR
jgi:transposase